MSSLADNSRHDAGRSPNRRSGAIAAQGQIAYGSLGPHVPAVDISNPTAPVRVAGVKGRSGYVAVVAPWVNVASAGYALRIAHADFLDCNNIRILDVNDIAAGASQDQNGDGVPDECEHSPADMNCDGAVDNQDIDGVVAALSGL